MSFGGARLRAASIRHCLPLPAFATACGTAQAHGFGQRYDLPVPLSFYLTGAAAVVVVSFVIMAAFVHLAPRRAGARETRTPSSHFAIPAFLLSLGRTLAVALLAIVVIAGFVGNPAPVKNIAPIMVWAVWWVGMAYVCALIGDVWAAFSPIDAVFAWMEKVYARISNGDRLARNYEYPESLGAWLAVLLFFCFAWSELVWDSSDVPRHVATAVLCYCALAWTGMFLFGRERWLARGEAFALVFSLFGRFAPLQITRRDGRVELIPRFYARGLLVDEPVPASIMTLVIVMLATVTFDGFMETPPWAAIAGQSGIAAGAVVATGGLAGMVLAFLAVYLACARLVASCAASHADAKPLPVSIVAGYFVLTLVPIAIGYNLAHYLSFIVMAGQYLIPLLSDPFGTGADFFGTANYIVRIGIVDAQFVWYTSVIAIVVGHIAAVCLAHAMALRVFGNRQTALRSQYPMLALMVAYTMVSLWIIAQPIVSSRFG